MIRLKITNTAKSFSPKDNYAIYNEEKFFFKDLKEAKEHLKELYGKCKRTKIYIDIDEHSVHCGYVYHFIDENYDNNNKRKKNFRQDWVEFAEVRTFNLKTKKGIDSNE